MTPQERRLVTELFDRLARLAPSPRDAEAERAIADGMARAPDAVYALVQTVLVQDEALKAAEARLRELSGDAKTAAGGGFLDSMRNTWGGRATSVPSVRPAPADAPDPRWNSGAAMAPGAQGASNAAPYTAPPAQGGSFLGTAAATAAGVIGGSLLFNALGGMFGQRSGSALADTPPANASSPWDSNTASSGDLARDAGVNDIGHDRAGLFDSDADSSGLGGDLGGDFGGDIGGGGDA